MVGTLEKAELLKIGKLELHRRSGHKFGHIYVMLNIENVVLLESYTFSAVHLHRGA
jgi:hypothetical protein